MEEIGEKARSIVQKLTDARLLVSKRDPTTDKDTIEVAHEALIRSWDRLKLWLNKDREFLLWRERLRASFTEWDRTQHDTESLLRGIALSEAERWGSERHHDLIGTEANFITESIRARKLRKRRLARVIISTLAIIILITTGFPVTFLLYFFHPGSYRPQWNEPASTTSRTTPTSASWSITDLEKADGRFVGLALSGIGSRAVNFNAGVMLELQRRGFLDKVDVISAVSGGAIPAAYYALGPENGGPFTDEAAHDAFGFDFQGAWIRHWFFPQNYYLVQGSDLTRSDILVQVLNERLYHRATFADFRPHPKLLINATLLNDTTRFTFTDDRFERLGSSLAAYRVANAVYASLATPGAFDSVTLVHHAMIVPWYVHISDGSSADKFGIEAILEYLNRNITGTTLSSLFPKGCMILLVDSLSTSEQPWMANQQSMRTVTDYFINKAALDVMEGRLLDSRGSMLARLGIPFEKQNRETYGRLPINDPNQCSCDVIHLALSHLVYLPQSDDELWSRVNNIENKLWISDDEQSDIFHAAKLLVQEIPTFEQSVQCGVKSLR